jgi:hypothetical protein
VRRLALTLMVSVSVLLSGVAVASVVVSSTHTPNPSRGAPPGRVESSDGGETGVDGGPIDRFHGSGSCELTSVGALPGNWTHGDYVSAVAMATGDSKMIVQAAHSDCGKPMVAVNHGGSPIGGLPSQAAPQAQEHGAAHVGAGVPGGSPGS